MNNKFNRFTAIAIATLLAFAPAAAEAKGRPSGSRGGPAPRRQSAPARRAPSRPAPRHSNFGGGRGGHFGGGRHRGSHHDREILGIGAGLLGTALVLDAIADAVSEPDTVVVTQPVVTTPVVTTPVVTTPVVTAPQYVNQTQQVWVEGRWIDQLLPDGRTTRVWQPGHYETVTVPVRVL